MASKVPEAGAFGAAEKKVKLLEQQRMEVGGQTGRSGTKAPPGSLVPVGPRSP
jgi:hypothetical protein